MECRREGGDGEREKRWSEVEQRARGNSARSVTGNRAQIRAMMSIAEERGGGAASVRSASRGALDRQTRSGESAERWRFVASGADDAAAQRRRAE